MQTLISLLSKGRYQSLFVYSRWLSNKRHEKIEGVRENFNEYEVRLHFDRWLKSLWLAPNQWVHSTRDRSITVTRCFLPFWSINFQGSIQCSLSTKANFPFRHDENYYSHKEWHPFPLEINNVSLNNINIYAAENFDKYHVQKLDVSFDDVQTVDLTEKDNIIIDKPTLDQETAFNNAWVLIMKPLLENMCLEEAKKIYPKFDEPRIDSLHLKINSKQQQLLYYPVYIIDYHYKSHLNYTCLFDGVTGHITGDRQYSTVKVTLATFVAFYPMIKIGLFCLGSLTDLLFAFELASNLSVSVSLPIALLVAPCVGFYASSYPKSYKKEISQVQYQQDKSKALKFTYDFIDSIQQQKEQRILQTPNDSSVDVESTKEFNLAKEHHTNPDLTIRKTEKDNS